jgi:RNA polymerase sigma factor (TIGR02999 family)
VAVPDVTSLLKAWADGDATAFEALVPVVHRELHRLARHCLSAERAAHSLQPTALINEAYLRLCAGTPVDWRDRSHFFATFARLMRRVLVDVARSRGRLKRGDGVSAAQLDEATTVPFERAASLVELDLALQALAQIDPRKSQVIELRFFGGFSVDETAAALGISAETVHRDWRLARAWLRRELRKDSRDGR